MQYRFYRTRRGLDILKTAKGPRAGSSVILTRKTTKSGKIRHGVVIEDHRNNNSLYLVASYEGILGAWKTFKALARA